MELILAPNVNVKEKIGVEIILEHYAACVVRKFMANKKTGATNSRSKINNSKINKNDNINPLEKNGQS